MKIKAALVEWGRVVVQRPGLFSGEKSRHGLEGNMECGCWLYYSYPWLVPDEGEIDHNFRISMGYF